MTYELLTLHELHAKDAAWEELATRMETYIKDRDYVSFAELTREFGKGDRSMCFAEYPNLVVWAGLSDDTAIALEKLLSAKRVFMRPTVPFVYMADGAVLKLPIAKSKRHYKKPHWAPMTLRVVDHDRRLPKAA
jgi:hypothetical protein